MPTKKTIKLTESALRSIIKESINEVLNEYSTDSYGDIYNKLGTKTDDPSYDERARRLRDKLTKHVHQRYGITGDDIENYQNDGQINTNTFRKYDIGNVPNKSLKGISKLRQHDMPGLGRSGHIYKLR